jgi:hypothetical protein
MPLSTLIPARIEQALPDAAMACTAAIHNSFCECHTSLWNPVTPAQLDRNPAIQTMQQDLEIWKG